VVLSYPFSRRCESEVGRTFAGAARASLRRLTLVEAGSLLPRVGPLGERTSVPGTRSPARAALRETLAAPGVVVKSLHLLITDFAKQE
jgi:hypothetical protein